MSYKKYGNPYIVNQTEPYKISRSKIELFSQCQRCFWLDARLKIKRPSSPPFQINKAIDELFKKEFDVHRSKKTQHPVMAEYNIDAIPYQHKDLNSWRENFIGIQALHKPTNLLVFGAVDDVWVTPSNELIVVDYKATAKKTEVNLDSDWQICYKRQLEVYQWLLRQNNFKVSNTGFFVYTNARLDLPSFGDQLSFKTKVIAHTGSDDWVEPTLVKMKQCLDGDIPEVGIAIMGGECEYCAYARSRTELTMQHIKKLKN
jgi:CRISPR/Cas system-associated exonuclease Cas4 (RecB family)